MLTKSTMYAYVQAYMLTNIHILIYVRIYILTDSTMYKAVQADMLSNTSSFTRAKLYSD